MIVFHSAHEINVHSDIRACYGESMDSSIKTLNTVRQAIAAIEAGKMIINDVPKDLGIDFDIIDALHSLRLAKSKLEKIIKF